MPMDSKKLINRFSWKRSLSALFSQLHKMHFADIWLVSAYTVTYAHGHQPHPFPELWGLEMYYRYWKPVQTKVFNLALKDAGRCPPPWFAGFVAAPYKTTRRLVRYI